MESIPEFFKRLQYGPGEHAYIVKNFLSFLQILIARSWQSYVPSSKLYIFVYCKLQPRQCYLEDDNGVEEGFEPSLVVGSAGTETKSHMDCGPKGAETSLLVKERI